jgi:hypothetical protein
MSMQDLTITDDLWEYMRRVTLREPEVLRKLRDETARLPNSNLQISAEQGQFMASLKPCRTTATSSPATSMKNGRPWRAAIGARRALTAKSICALAGP